MPLRSVVDPAECRLNRRTLDPVGQEQAGCGGGLTYHPSIGLARDSF
jgi:hypothetical protein